MKQRRRVVVTGCGAVTPVGNNRETSWKSLIEGKCGISRITQFDPEKFDSQIAGEVKDFDPSSVLDFKELKRTARFVQLALAAADEAAKQSEIQFDKIDPHETGVIVGSGIGCLKTIEEQTMIYYNRGPRKLSPLLIPMLIVNEAAGHISIRFKIKGPNSCIATACASGSHAIGEAFKTIERGDADVMFAGGSEACIVPTGVGGFCAMKALSKRNSEPEKASRPFDLNRDGFVMGEGAGVIVLEEIEHAKKRGAKIIAEMVGYGSSGDGYHITAPDPTGDGPMRAMKMALDDAGLKPEDVSYVNPHGTSTKLNDKIETLAVKTLFKDYAYKIPMSSTKGHTGHLLGAAGGVEFIVCCMAIRDGIVPATLNRETPDPECDLDYVVEGARKVDVKVAMSNSLGFGGHNASLVVKRFEG